MQNQIEALQQQQQALYQQQLASNQVLSFQTPGLAPNRAAAHRRVQSTAPMGVAGSNLNSFPAPQPAMGQFGNIGGLGLGLDGQPQGVPRGHGRRHSVNVVKTPGGQGSVSYGNPYAGQDGFEDGFASPSFGGHSRQVSRADSSWRISKLYCTCFFIIVLNMLQMEESAAFTEMAHLLLTLLKLKHSFRVSSSSVQLLVDTTTRCRPSVSLICFPT